MIVSYHLLCYYYAIYLQQQRIINMDYTIILKRIRQQILLSQKDFADAIGVSFSTVNRWENGKNIPNFKDLKKISDYCYTQNIPFNIQNIFWEDK